MKEKLFNRNFVLILFGQSISMLGTATLRFTLSLYVLDITGSAAIFGIFAAISMIPTILLAPIGGIMADRFNRSNLMVILDMLYSIISFFLFLTLSLSRTILLIGIVMVLLSVISSFESPVVQSSIPLLHSKSNLVKANSAVNTISMVANMLGPILAGLLYGFFGAKRVILVSSLCFFIAAILEMFIIIPFDKSNKKQNIFETVKSDLKESLYFILKTQPNIFNAILVIASINTFISSMLIVGLPYMIRIILELGSELYGLTEGIMAAAGLIGGILAGIIGKKFKIENIYILLVMSGVGLIPIGLSFYMQLNAMSIYLVITICCIGVQSILSLLSIFLLTSIQSKTPANLLGRVMAYVVTLSTCSQPLGQAIYGIAFDRFAGILYVIVLLTAFTTISIGFISKKTFIYLSNS